MWRALTVPVILGVSVVAHGAPRTFEVRYAAGEAPVAVELGSDGKPGVPRPPDRARDIDAREISRAVLTSDAKATLLAVYAAYCGPCRRQMPSAAALADAHRNQGLRVLAFSLDPDAELFERYVLRFRGMFEPLRIRSGGNVSAELRILGMNPGRSLTIPRFGLFDHNHRLISQSNRIDPLRAALPALL